MKTRAALLLSLLALAGCAKNNASVYVAAVCAAPDDATACSFEATCSLVSGGNLVDVGVTRVLLLALELHNQLASNADESRGRVNTNDAFVQEYDIEYVGVTLPKAHGLVPGSGRVPTGGTAVLFIPAVPAAIGNALAGVVGAGGSGEFIARLRLSGVYQDTTKFETGEFDIPVTVCNGCFTPLACTTGTATYCPHAGQFPSSAACVD